MDVKVVFLCIETALLVLFLIIIIVACELTAKWRRAYEDLNYSVKSKAEAEENAEAVKESPEPAGYVLGADLFLDRLTADERAEFYKTFIEGTCCGLKYKVGEDNSAFFSGVFIYLSGVRFAVSDSLMYKICVEYDRLRGMPVTADNK